MLVPANHTVKPLEGFYIEILEDVFLIVGQSSHCCMLHFWT